MTEQVLLREESDESAVQPPDAGPASPTIELLRRVMTNPSAVAGAALLLLMVCLAVFAPLLARYNPNAIDISSINQEPSGAHWFGTDYLGRDVWARCLYGGRISLSAGIQVVLIGFAIGTTLGLVAGYVRGVADDIIMRLMDVLFSFPGLLLAIGVVAILGPGLESAAIAVGIALVPSFARMARASALSAREHDYVLAARVVGARHGDIIFRHMLANVVGPLIVLATLSLGGAILVTAGLSYLGLGTQLPTSDWGTMLSGGYSHMFEAWSEVAFPGLFIVLTVLGINLLGDGLSDAFNPRL